MPLSLHGNKKSIKRAHLGVKRRQHASGDHAPPPPYSPIAGRDETVLSDTSSSDCGSDTASDSGHSTCTSPSSSCYSPVSSPIHPLVWPKAPPYAATTDVPAYAPPSKPQACPACKGGYSASQLGLTCPHDCAPLRVVNM